MRRRSCALWLLCVLAWGAACALAQLVGHAPTQRHTALEPVRTSDLELSNIALVTAVDGSLHGVDRTSGRPLWKLHADAGANITGHGALDALARPLVFATYGAQQHSFDQVLRDAVDTGDTHTLHALRTTGIYIVEPSSRGELYVLRMEGDAPAGARRPHLERLPLTLPELVDLSPFSFSSDDTRIFVAHKHTHLVELNVFSGTVGAVFESGAAAHTAAPRSQCAGGGERDSAARMLGTDASESPWVYIGRTDYTLTVHVQDHPEATQSLSYSVYAPNHADRDIELLWNRLPQPVDDHALLAAPDDGGGVVCYRIAPQRRSWKGSSPPPLPPVQWRRTFEATAVDVFDVVFAPPRTAAGHAPLLRPVVVPHAPTRLLHLLEQQAQAARPSTYLGVGAGGSLFALGRSQYPLVAHAAHASITDVAEPAPRRPGSSHPLHQWIGGYDVASVPDARHVPLLESGRGPTTGTLPGATLPPPEGVLGSVRAWLPQATKLNLARLLGLLLVLGVLVRGYAVIRRDRAPLILDASVLRFEGEPTGKSEALAGQGEVPVDGAATPSRPATPGGTPEVGDDSINARRRRRRRGRRAGAAVLARTGGRQGGDDEGEGDSLDTSVDGGRVASGSRDAVPEESTKSDEKPAAAAAVAAAGAAAAAVPGTDAAAAEPNAPPPPPTDGPLGLCLSEEVLGYGSSGTVVFRGTFQGRAVAVKRLLRDFVQMASKEVSLLQSADNHPNVIRYFYQELTPNFLFIALEQCPASLADLVERPLEHSALAPLLEPRQAFRQITAGLQHLHSLSIVHRDIKPQNILVTQTAQGRLRMLLSDFGLSKRIDSVAQNSFSQTVNQPGGTAGWRAPEVLRGDLSLNALVPPGEGDERARLTRAVDIFSLGCVTYYMFTRGGHPFGAQYEREMNILRREANLDALRETGEESAEVHALILSMIQYEAQLRPSAAQVARHPFFWSAQQRISFLQDVSDRIETLERDPPAPALVLLETNAAAVVGSDWRRRFDRPFLDDLGKFRKYDGASVQDLLRAFRNKKHHFQDMAPQLKKQLSPMPEGFLHYFACRFPLLFMHVYEALEQLPVLRSEPMFRGYYEDRDAADT